MIRFAYLFAIDSFNFQFRFDNHVWNGMKIANDGIQSIQTLRFFISFEEKQEHEKREEKTGGKCDTHKTHVPKDILYATSSLFRCLCHVEK